MRRRLCVGTESSIYDVVAVSDEKLEKKMDEEFRRTKEGQV